MKAALVSAVLLSLVASGVRAQEIPGRPELPGDGLIRTLITLAEEIRSDQIKVAVVLRGEVHGEGDFVCREAARVHLVMPVIEHGRKVRRVAERIFLWNEKWGWFCYRTEQQRGGEVILVFSEKEGRAEFK